MKVQVDDIPALDNFYVKLASSIGNLPRHIEPMV